MSGSDDNNGNKTVFRPSPLSGLKSGQPQQGVPLQQGISPQQEFPQQPGYTPPPTFSPTPQAPSFGAPDAAAQPAYQPAGSVRLSDDDIPVPSTPRDARNLLVTEAGPVLALAASVRSGRARIAMPDFHRQASEAIAAFDRAIAPVYPDETRQRARYALCATVDDIAQNLPGIGHDGAEWARRSLVVQFFRENIGGDRFWQLVDDMLARPTQNIDLIELFHACLAAGFEGRFRIMPDGKSRLQGIMGNLYGAMDHPRSLSQLEITRNWRGILAPLRKISLFSQVALAAAAAALLLLAIYVVLRLVLMTSGDDSWNAASKLTPDAPMRLSRSGAPPPAAADSAQVSRLKKFLEPEIQQGLVAVEEDASTVRVRTTVGQLFQSGSDQLEPGRRELFERVGRAIEAEKGAVTIEGHADSDKVSSLAFPDNMALSKARADAVASVIGGVLSNPGRISSQGFGDSQPLASNDTAEGKTKNRRVEIVVPRLQP
jgi:type VI secretion system protein ImpK